MNDDAILLALERDSAERTARVRQILLDEGRPDLVAELDANLRDVRTGVSGARSTWHSISAAQRRVLLKLAAGYRLVRAPASRTQYDARGAGDAISRLCSIRTARALCAHELIACDGDTFDPECVFVLTERGRFVVSIAISPSLSNSER